MERIFPFDVNKRTQRRRGERRYYHTASVAAFNGQGDQVAFTASKAAVAGMTLPNSGLL